MPPGTTAQSGTDLVRRARAFVVTMIASSRSSIRDSASWATWCSADPGDTSREMRFDSSRRRTFIAPNMLRYLVPRAADALPL